MTKKNTSYKYKNMLYEYSPKFKVLLIWPILTTIRCTVFFYSKETVKHISREKKIKIPREC